MIDHINGIRSDNRLCNLRLASASQNNMNSNRTHKSNGLPKGVCWKPANNKYQARIKVNGRDRSLGMYATKWLAYDAYLAGAIKHYGEFACF